MTAAGGGGSRSCALTIEDDNAGDGGEVAEGEFPFQTQSIVNVTIEKMRNFPNPFEKL